MTESQQHGLARTQLSTSLMSTRKCLWPRLGLKKVTASPQGTDRKVQKNLNTGCPAHQKYAPNKFANLQTPYDKRQVRGDICLYSRCSPGTSLYGKQQRFELDRNSKVNKMVLITLLVLISIAEKSNQMSLCVTMKSMNIKSVILMCCR